MLRTEIYHREILLFFPSPPKSHFIYEWIVSGLFLVTFIVGFAFNLTTGGIGTIEFLLIFLKNHKKKTKGKNDLKILSNGFTKLVQPYDILPHYFSGIFYVHFGFCFRH